MQSRLPLGPGKFHVVVLVNMLGDQKRITTINKLKTIQILEVYKYI